MKREEIPKALLVLLDNGTGLVEECAQCRDACAAVERLNLLMRQRRQPIAWIATAKHIPDSTPQRIIRTEIVDGFDFNVNCTACGNHRKVLTPAGREVAGYIQRSLDTTKEK